jgi:histidinol-phosphatase
MDTYSEDLEFAFELADLADEISLARFSALDLKIDTKPDLSPVTDADMSIERAIKQKLEQLRPSDGVIGEEYGESGTKTRQWIVDPIDGTANFMRGVPVWGTLIALAIDSKPLVSVVSAPALGRRWWASPDAGAFTRELSGVVRRLQVSSISELATSSFSYNSLKGWQQSGYLEQLLSISSKVWRTRAYGDFWSYMLLAEGSVDIVAEHDLKIYDIAALVPIIEQAGGVITGFDGLLNPDTSSILATNGSLHEEITHFLKK